MDEDDSQETTASCEAKQLSDQISELITIDSMTQFQESKLNDEIDAMLVKITEFMELVEMIRSDTNICVNSTLPLVTEKSKKLQETFHHIDDLERFVSHIDENLKKLESQAEVAQAHFNTFSSLKKRLFGALSTIGRKHTDTTLQHQKLAHDQSRQPLESVHIFSTAEFFPPEISRNEDDKQSNSAN